MLVLALTLLIPELVQSFHSLYVQIEANIPRWTAYLSAQNTDMGWLMSWLEGINWEQLLHKITAGIDTVLVNAVGAVSATVNIVVTASFALIISIYMSLWDGEPWPSRPHTGVCLPEARPRRRSPEILPAVPSILRKLSDRTMQRSGDPWRSDGPCVFHFQDPLRQSGGGADRHLRHHPPMGALISCVVSVFLVLLVDPVLAVRCLIVYLAVQFIENQFIYPVWWESP